MNESMDPEALPPTPADAFRQALYWNFIVAPGLVIRCRHLDFQDLLLCGAVPLPVLDAFKSLLGDPGVTMRTVLDNTERREVTLNAARVYAVQVALSPRISLLPTEDPAVLSLATETADGTPRVSDLTDGVLVRLMNEGVSRRLGVDVAGLGLFRRSQPAAAHSPASDGGAVPDAPEPLAPAGDATQH